MTKETAPELSAVITIYNDAAIVESLVSEVHDCLRRMGRSFELLLVDDGSTDLSMREIERQCAKFEAVKAVSLSRNFGQQIAVSAGIHLSRGDAVLVMDGDLQNPTDAIPLLYDELRKGRDIVYAVSGTRDGVLAIVTSRLFYFALRRIFQVEIIRDQLMMRMMSRRFCECYKLYPEVKRTVAAIVHDIGMPYAVVQVKNRNRSHGRSNYGFLKRVSLFIDVVLSLTNNPLDVMIYLGLFIFSVTLLASSYYVWRSLHAFAPTAAGATILSIAFFGSLMLLALGVMGRYLSNIYAEVRQRPLFFVEKRVKVDVE